MDFWPESYFVELPAPPLMSITSVAVLDQAGLSTAYDSANYFVVTEGIPGLIVVKDGCTPPINTNRYTAGIRVEYKAGYGSAASNVPQPIREAIKLWSIACYEQRAMSATPPPDARTLLNMFKVIKL
jgi:uncharacterized phiE125 gp8 family phage protein